MLAKVDASLTELLESSGRTSDRRPSGSLIAPHQRDIRFGELPPWPGTTVMGAFLPRQSCGVGNGKFKQTNYPSAGFVAIKGHRRNTARKSG
jgi:hypothetical protein